MCVCVWKGQVSLSDLQDPWPPPEEQSSKGAHQVQEVCVLLQECDCALRPYFWVPEYPVFHIAALHDQVYPHSNSYEGDTYSLAYKKPSINGKIMHIPLKSSPGPKSVVFLQNTKCVKLF